MNNYLNKKVAIREKLFEYSSTNIPLNNKYNTTIGVITNIYDNKFIELDNKILIAIDYIYKIVEDIHNSRGMVPFSQDQLYHICDEGEERYEKSIPPGFKDKKDKDGIRKYSDLIIWKEIINYAKENQLDIIFVTDDVKADWWEKESEFHPKLINEFG